MVLSWSAATSLLQRQKKMRKGQSIVIHHTIYTTVAVGWQVNCSGHAQCATLRQKNKLQKLRPLPPQYILHVAAEKKTITTLTHSSTSKKRTKNKTDGIIVALYSGPHNPTAGKKERRKKRIRIRLRKRGKKHFNPKQAIARWWETHP